MALARRTDAMPERCPKYLRLAKAFEHQLRTGVLRIGDRMPSVRQLRASHHISAATALGCYAWLERQGYLHARPKSGFYVRRVPLDDGPPPAIARRPRGPVAVKVAGLSADPAAGRGREFISMGAAVVGPALLPQVALNRSTRLALSAFADAAVRPPDPRGSRRLRRQIAQLMFRRGLSCSPDEVLITGGEADALHLCLRAVTRPGDVVAVESPGCYVVLRALEALGLQAVEIPHVRNGVVDQDLLAEAVAKHRVKALLVVATCHNVLGDCASDESKAALVSFAARHGIAVIEGDPFGDLVFGGARPRPLASFDPSGVVMQRVSLAHYVAPGFEVGWALGGRRHAELEKVKALTGGSGAALPQLALAEFLESGAFDTHVRRLRLALWQSVEAARRDVLASFPKGTRVSRPEGGFVLWVQLPERYDGVEVARAAAGAGIEVLAGPLFSPTGRYRDCIRISCGQPFDVLRPALRSLAALL